MKIGDCELTKRTFIIAEIGANHEGDIEAAKELVRAAAKARVDAVKFQTYRADKIVVKSERERYEHFKQFELNEEEFVELAKLARKQGLKFLSTPFDIETVDFLNALVPAFKVASSDLTYLPLIEHIAKKSKPILLSTGMSNVREIWQAIEAVKSANNKIIEEEKLILLHCVSSYPVKIDEANLRAITFMKETFHLPVGYSDHTLGILASRSAVALGACVIEKHFTLNKYNREFRDHQLSADIEDMTELVHEVRLVEKSLGDYQKEPMECELTNMKLMRRSLAAKKDILQGSIITEDMLTALRPEKGIPANRLKQAIGKRSRRNISKGEILFQQDIEGF